MCEPWWMHTYIWDRIGACLQTYTIFIYTHTHIHLMKQCFFLCRCRPPNCERAPLPWNAHDDEDHHNHQDSRRRREDHQERPPRDLGISSRDHQSTTAMVFPKYRWDEEARPTCFATSIGGGIQEHGKHVVPKSNYYCGVQWCRNPMY